LGGTGTRTSGKAVSAVITSMPSMVVKSTPQVRFTFLSAALVTGDPELRIVAGLDVEWIG